MTIKLYKGSDATGTVYPSGDVEMSLSMHKGKSIISLRGASGGMTRQSRIVLHIHSDEFERLAEYMMRIDQATAISAFGAALQKYNPKK